MTMTCIAFKPLARGALLGFADLQMASGIVLKECTFMQSAEAKWVSPPGKPQLGADKLPVIKEGKIVYSQVVDFVDRATRRKWSDAAVAAIEDFIARRPDETGRYEGGKLGEHQKVRHG